MRWVKSPRLRHRLEKKSIPLTFKTGRVGIFTSGRNQRCFRIISTAQDLLTEMRTPASAARSNSSNRSRRFPDWYIAAPAEQVRSVKAEATEFGSRTLVHI